MNQNSGAAVIVAALIVGGAILAGTLLLRSAIVGAGQEMASLREAIERAPTAPSPAQQARPARPDPSRRYSVNTKGAPVKGDPDAKLAIIEFSDFECPFCRKAEPTVARIQQQYGDQVKVVFKHLPLAFHQRAPAAHAAAEAAHRQGRFWEMHDKIFSDPAAMSPEKYLEYAREIGLDLEKFRRDLEDPAVSKRIAADAAEAARLGVTGTPSFFVNGRFLAGAQPFESFQALIDQELGG